MIETKNLLCFPFFAFFYRAFVQGVSLESGSLFPKIARFCNIITYDAFWTQKWYDAIRIVLPVSLLRLQRNIAFLFLRLTPDNNLKVIAA